jgi:hypothetical protein
MNDLLGTKSFFLVQALWLQGSIIKKVVNPKADEEYNELTKVLKKNSKVME